MCSEFDINCSVQRCTELFIEAKLHPIVWRLLIRYYLDMSNMFGWPYNGAQMKDRDLPKLDVFLRQYRADINHIPSYQLSNFAYEAFRYHLVKNNILEIDDDGNYKFSDIMTDSYRDADPLQRYSAMKCKILDSLDIELCLKVNFVLDVAPYPYISAETIMDNIHNPFMNQYDFLYVGNFRSTDVPKKRKHVSC